MTDINNLFEEYMIEKETLQEENSDDIYDFFNSVYECEQINENVLSATQEKQEQNQPQISFEEYMIQEQKRLTQRIEELEKENREMKMQIIVMKTLISDKKLIIEREKKSPSPNYTKTTSIKRKLSSSWSHPSPPNKKNNNIVQTSIKKYFY